VLKTQICVTRPQCVKARRSASPARNVLRLSSLCNVQIHYSRLFASADEIITFVAHCTACRCHCYASRVKWRCRSGIQVLLKHLSSSLYILIFRTQCCHCKPFLWRC